MCAVPLSAEASTVLRSLNPWWGSPADVRPAPPEFQRPALRGLAARLSAPRALIEVLRGPRQVGKTTGLHQVVRDLLRRGVGGRDILFVRFDLELLRDEPSGLRRIVRWFADAVRERPLDRGAPAYVLLDEIHKLPRWNDEVKHLFDTFPLRILLTGSSSVLVAKGGRESLAGRSFTTELPPFTFREVLECWHPTLAVALPPRLRFTDVFDGRLRAYAESFSKLKAQQKLAIRRKLERYYTRGGYPRLHSGEVDDDRWADYVVQTVFESVLGNDIPDLFPVEQPRLLRALYLEVAKRTGQELAQNALTQTLTLQGFATNQPTVGRYLHYLADALLIREFRRYPLAKKASARVPVKITLSDLGVRNAILRGAPSVWESDPAALGPAIETLAQTVIRDVGLQVHFFRDFATAGNRRSPMREVDFVAERLDGDVLPVEVKFRKRIDAEDLSGIDIFRERFQSRLAVVVTRELHRWDAARGALFLPLEAFLSAF
jgi:hypothetical protein